MQSLLIFIIYAFLGYYALKVLRSLFAKKWPKAEGEIVSSALESVYINGMTHTPKIEFTYVVRGRKYKSDKIAIGFSGVSSKNISASIVNKYYVNKTVDIYYNPKKPNQGVLLTGIHNFHLNNLIFFGITLFVVHVFVFN